MAVSYAAYGAIYGAPLGAVTFTPTTGTAFGSTQAQIEELTPAPSKIDTAKYTPISGVNAGIEQFTLTKTPVQELKIKATYGKTEHAAAMTCQAAKITGTLLVTYSDGSTDTFAIAALTDVQMSASNSTATITDDLTFAVVMPPVFAAGT